MSRFFFRVFLVGAIALGIAGFIVGLGWLDRRDEGLTAPILIRQEAVAQARKEGKRLLIWFTAAHRDRSEVDYCGLMDKFFADREVQSALEKHFVVKRLDIHEVFGGEHVYLDLGQWRGVPAISLLDAQGVVLADSGDDQATNFGFPDTPQQLEAFRQMMKKGCPEMPDEALQRLHHKLVRIRDAETQAVPEQPANAGC